MRLEGKDPARGWRRAYLPVDQGPISDDVPDVPAAVMLWDDRKMLRCLALDLDAHKNGKKHREQVERDYDALMSLLTRCGFRPIGDASAMGGRHIYAELPVAVTLPQLTEVTHWLNSRFASLDIGPMSNTTEGCIRPSGARHYRGGFQALITPLADVRAAIRLGPAEDAWERLCELAPPLETPSPSRTLPEQASLLDPPVSPPADPQYLAQPITRDQHTAYMPADALRIAVHGPSPDFPKSESEARWRVEMCAAEAGISAETFASLVDTQWPWLQSSYSRKSPEHIDLSYGNALDTVKKRQSPAHSSMNARLVNTSQRHPLRGGSPDPYLRIRKWLTLARQTARWRRLSPGDRAILAALAAFAIAQGRELINGGVRSYAEAAGYSYSHISNRLKLLAELGLLERVSRGISVNPDVWRLNTEAAAGCTPASGRIESLKPVFLVLGHLAGEVFEELVRVTTVREHGDPDSTTAVALSKRLGYTRAKTSDALKELAVHGLAEPSRRGWLVGPADPDEVARQLGASDLAQDRHELHVAQRAAWKEWLENPQRRAPRHRRIRTVLGQLTLAQLHDEALRASPEQAEAELAALANPPPGHFLWTDSALA